MATTTPNYGWPVPTSTDYVKDGATAIEALGDAIDASVFTQLNVVAEKTAAYTFASGDQNDLIQLNGTFTVSIPTDATFNFAIGTQINILNVGSGTITVAAVTPGTTTLNGTPGLKLRAQWSSATLIKRAANTWVILGDLSA
jgi:hypothetical protein